MTGSEIQKKLNDTHFFGIPALTFRADKFRKLDTPALALEFLTLYCASLSTAEYMDDNDKLYKKKLSKTYLLVESILKKKGQICSTEFLSNPPEKLFFVLRDNTCFILE